MCFFAAVTCFVVVLAVFWQVKGGNCPRPAKSAWRESWLFGRPRSSAYLCTWACLRCEYHDHCSMFMYRLRLCGPAEEHPYEHGLTASRAVASGIMPNMPDTSRRTGPSPATGSRSQPLADESPRCLSALCAVAPDCQRKHLLMMLSGCWLPVELIASNHSVCLCAQRNKVATPA